MKSSFNIKPKVREYIRSNILFSAITNCSLFFLSHYIKIHEKKKIEYFGNKKLKHDPFFIVGAPRTGSTILYQVLTNSYNFLYVDNLICKLHRNFFFGFWLSNKIFSDQPHNIYKSEFGDTSRYGMHAPSECGDFWYRWLPRDHHFVDYDEVTEEIAIQIRSEVTAVINYFDKPILFKNLNAGQRLRLIRKCFPNAKFIYIKRQPFFVVQSILKARAIKNVPHNKLWSVMPNDHTSLLSLDEVSMVTAQVYYLQLQIKKDLSLFDRKNVQTIDYESMVTDFSGFLSKLERSFEFCETIRHKSKIMLPDFTMKNRVTVGKDMASKIYSALNKYEWDRSYFETNLS